MRFLPCLFCKHTNPAEASFCNECGSPLHLQPCEQCGAIDKRSAASCHKCGAEFPPYVTSELSAESVADEIDAVLATLDAPYSDGSFDRSGADRGRVPVPESVAQALALLHEGWQPAGQAGGENATRPGLADRPPPAEPASVDERLAVDREPSAVRSSPARWLALAALMLLLMVGAVYHDWQASPQRAETPAGVTGSPVVGGAATKPETPPDAAFPASGRPAVASVAGADRDLPPVPPAAGTAKPARPRPAADVATKPRPEPPRLGECPDAVAALGLCNVNTNQGRP
ncbi:zinc ribbon domain-containing protein [Accumulibacter sp.]|uniref:double zinc ribbon domain-containing protein n=1 Tax=Accumulibacter sp. TaxID=2053492 RepID=UPI0026067A33|nr:zinc ribbon domain-containing protein [Accumulibacter sp.]